MNEGQVWHVSPVEGQLIPKDCSLFFMGSLCLSNQGSFCDGIFFLEREYEVGD